MSIHTWMQEYYPTPAREIAFKGTQASLEHGLLKFRGCKEENLARHGLVLKGNSILDAQHGVEMFQLGWSECGLCWIYQSYAGPRKVDLGCEGCPLSWEDSEGKPSYCYDDNRGWGLLRGGQGPEILIEELETALETWKRRGVVEESGGPE